MLHIYLKAPDGTEIELSSDNGGTSDDYGNPNDCPNTTSDFSPIATVPITSGSAPFIGTFLPEGDFSDFDGKNPNGDWTLRVCEDGNFGSGTLDYFDITFFEADCIGNSGITRIYVDKDAGGTGNGSSWTNAITDLQTAINATLYCPDITEIWVAEGTYYPTETPSGNSSPGNERLKTFHGISNIALYGGFEGNENDLSERNWRDHPTVLSGNIGDPNDDADNCYHVVRFDNAPVTTTLDGFTVTKGNADGSSSNYDNTGGGILNYSTQDQRSPQVKNCKIIDNAAYRGGAIANIGFQQGGAFPKFSNCLIVNNTASNSGGAIYCLADGDHVGSPQNVLHLVNSTLYGNTASSLGRTSYIVAIDGGGTTMTVSNCIIWGATGSHLAKNFFAGYPNVNNSIIQSGCPNNSCTNIITDDPQLIDPVNGNYELTACSPALDSGVSSNNPPPTDYNDNPRPHNGDYDMGAFEYQGAVSTITCYQDSDDDNFGNPNNSQTVCSTCPSGYVTDNTDCDDNDANEFPGQTWHKDADGDDYGDGTSQTACQRPANHYLASELMQTSGDCDDGNANIHPGATEICDGIDNNCNSQTDEGITFQDYYLDNDGDGFGTGAAVNDCQPPSANHVTQNGDCDDNNSSIHPNATEVCDGIDNNCNSQTDEGVTSTFYEDSDGDGFGNPNSTTQACSAPSGFVSNNTDCDDNDANEFPGQTWHKDADGDDYGDGTSQTSCERPANHYLASELTQTSGDCDDDHAGVNPGATEVCGDNIDNDCDSQIDEGCCDGPEAICQDFTAELDGAGNISISASDIDNGSTAPCGLQSLNLDITDFDCTDIGNNPHIVTLTITDVNNTTVDCTAEVTVEDNTAPNALCKNATIELNNTGQAMLLVSDIEDNSTDNCGIFDYDLDKTNFDCSETGTHEVKLTVTDNYGQTNECFADVTVQDNQNPNAKCKNIEVPCSGGTVTIDPSDVDNGSSDNCNFSLDLDEMVLDCSVTTHTVTLTVTDDSGNEDDCTALVSLTVPTTLSIENVSKLEGNFFGFTFYIVPVTRSGSSFTSVEYATADGTATVAGNDYLPASGTLYWPNGGSNTKYVVVLVKKDNIYEPDEIFNINLSNPGNGAVITDGQSECTIENDDAATIIGNNDPQFEANQSLFHNSRVTLYPNPAREDIMIEVPQNWLENQIPEAILYDNLGRVIIRFQMNDIKKRMDIQSLKSGIYFLTFYKGGKELSTERLVKTD